jgi:putative pyruvate formate lyase activating enzyme
MSVRTIPARFFLSSADFRAAYLNLGAAELRRRAAEALELLRACVACPRDCGVDRLADRYAVCKTGRHARVSSFFPHFGEEDCLRGWRGSGTIFFAWCNLRCAFCLAPDVRIHTDGGVRRIEDLFLGAHGEGPVSDGLVRSPDRTRVQTREGRLAPATKVFRHHYDGELVVIKPYGLPALTITPEHELFASLGPEGEIQKVAAGSLTNAFWLVAPKTLRNRVTTDLDPAQDRVPVRGVQRTRCAGPVYNIEVDDPDHSYTANGIAVGNCQNFDISQEGHGREVGAADLAQMMLFLQDAGCHNINFVTPEHVVPQILEALPLAVERGLRLPLVYNTSAYDSAHSLRLLDGIVDIYMPDFKFWDREMSRLYLKAPDYPEVARRVIKEMHRQVGALKLDEHGLARRGVLLRHLVMPGEIAGTREICQWVAAEVSPETYVNVMDQYHPAGRVGTDSRYQAINRRLYPREFAEANRAAREAGLHRLDARAPRGPHLRWASAEEC